jgi:predicted naringenin-chalcone synthase
MHLQRDDSPFPGLSTEASMGARATMEIGGIGTALPPFSIAQEDAAAVAKSLRNYSGAEAARIDKLYGLTRVKRRHSVVLDAGGPEDGVAQSFFPAATSAEPQGPRLGARMETYEARASELAIDAAANALGDASVPCHDVTHLITVSCSGFCAPGVDIALIKGLGLPPTVARTHVGFMGCHGALNAMRVARGFVESQPDAIVLVVAIELCSLHYQYSDEDEVNLANGLFSDGAAALVARRSTDEGAGAWRCIDAGSCVLPDSEDAMTWRIRDHGFQMTLSREVPQLIRTHLTPWLSAWLARHGLSKEQIGSWAVHPGGPAILQGVQAALNLTRDDLRSSWEVLAECGNMSSPTILFVLERLRARAVPRPCVALGFGPGLAVEAQLFTD